MCIGGGKTQVLPLPPSTPIAVEKTEAQEKEAVNTALEKQRREASAAAAGNNSILTGDSGKDKLGQKGAG